MSVTKVFNPRLNQYTYYIEENGQLIPLTYEDGLKQGLAVLEQIRAEIADLSVYYDNDYFSGNKDGMFKCNEVLEIIDKVLKEHN